MNKHIQKIIDKVIDAKESSQCLALSACLGIFFACSPFLGIQTILLIITGMLTGLNIPIALIILFMVNNPFTMIPIIILDYIAGYFLLHYILGHDFSHSGPLFLSHFDTYIRRKLHAWAPTLQFSLTYYLVGGVILASLFAIISYPLLVRWFSRLKNSKVSS